MEFVEEKFSIRIYRGTILKISSKNIDDLSDILMLLTRSSCLAVFVPSFETSLCFLFTNLSILVLVAHLPSDVSAPTVGVPKWLCSGTFAFSGVDCDGSSGSDDSENFHVFNLF